MITKLSAFLLSVVVLLWVPSPLVSEEAPAQPEKVGLETPREIEAPAEVVPTVTPEDLQVEEEQLATCTTTVLLVDNYVCSEYHIECRHIPGELWFRRITKEQCCGTNCFIFFEDQCLAICG